MLDLSEQNFDHFSGSFFFLCQDPFLPFRLVTLYWLLCYYTLIVLLISHYMSIFSSSSIFSLFILWRLFCGVFLAIRRLTSSGTFWNCFQCSTFELAPALFTSPCKVCSTNISFFHDSDRCLKYCASSCRICSVSHRFQSNDFSGIPRIVSWNCQHLQSFA